MSFIIQFKLFNILSQLLSKMCTYIYIYIYIYMYIPKMAATWTGCRFHALFFPYKTIEEHNTANCCLCLFCFFIFFTGHVISIFQLEMIQMYFFQSSKLQVVKNCWDDSPWAFLRERIGLVRAFLVGIHQFGHGAFWITVLFGYWA